MYAPADSDTVESKSIPQSAVPRSNLMIARKFVDFADLLEQQEADGFREQAYRNAADFLSTLEKPVENVLRTLGRRGLIAFPTIGKSIASAISELVLTGRWAQLDRLRGDLSPEKLFQTIPGIGPVLAKRLADEFHLETLDDLEAEMYLGKRKIGGLGQRRRQAIAAVLAERLGHTVFSVAKGASVTPPVDMLMTVDEMYRKRAAVGQLKKITPKRFNPEGRPWLPIMHARHDDWHFTALFSNSRLAHQLGKTDDWVIIYFYISGQQEGRCTVVTETRGANAGKRVVRGLEDQQTERHGAEERRLEG